MDFVVIGLVLSALALLTGLTLLCLVAPRWFRKASVAQPGDSAYARAQAGERHALGQGFLCAGAVLLVITFGGISAGLTDKAGAYLIATVATVAVISLFGWDVLYRRQHLIPQRRRAAPVKAHSDVPESSALDSDALPASRPATSTMARRRVLPARQRTAPSMSPVAASEEPFDDMVDDQPRAGEDQPLADVLEPVTEVAATQAAAEERAESVAESHELSIDPDSTGDFHARAFDETVGTDAAAEEPVAAPDVSPNPVALDPVQANGTTDVSSSSTLENEPEIPFADDRVIALFPTASARRSRTIVAPTDSDGQS